jgi:hypothetical protein
MSKADDQPTDTRLSPQTTPDSLRELAVRLRAYVKKMRNPAAKAGIGADIVVAADVLDRLVDLHAEVTSLDKTQACVDAVLKLIGEQ